MTDIWLPNLGTVPFDVYRAENAVSDYDSDLMLGRNEATGDWHVLVKNGPHGGPFPVFSIGQELPSYDRLQQMLYEHDVRRHGAKIVEAIERKKRAAREQLDKEAHDRAEEAAEFMEWGFRKLGQRRTTHIFVPS